jgi:hypothetical protein
MLPPSLRAQTNRKSGPPSMGCSMTAWDTPTLRRLYPALGDLPDGGSGYKNITRTTGNRDIDVALDKAISRLSADFHVTPGFGFFDDSASPNAFAMDRGIFPGTSQTVLFGSTCYSQWMDYDPSGVTIIAVIAHEFGHVMQFASGR